MDSSENPELFSNSAQGSESERADGAIKSKSSPSVTGQKTLHQDKEDFYNMHHARRGRAVIFNQMNFKNDTKLFREGSEVDEKNLVKTFEKYGFEVIVFRDCNKEEIDYLFDKYRTDPNLTDEDCLVICYLSHGVENEKLYTIKEGEFITVQELLDPFTAERCPQMAGKPKLVFVQACKGQKIDKGSKIQVDGIGQLRNEEQKTFNKQSFTIPNNADFFVAYSTCEGYASLRDTNDGSWFVQCLCKQLEKEETHSMSIFQWMTKVNRMVAMEQADNVPLMLGAGQVILERVKQCSAFTSRLTKDLILAPKVTRRN